MSGVVSRFYEDNHRLDQYLSHRHRPVASPNLVMEEPAFLAAVGSLAGRRVLDLGCGDGNFGRHCAAAGCTSYLGVDGAAGMIERARAQAGTVEQYEVADMATFEPQADAYDVVASRLALHYLDDLGHVLAGARAALVDDGIFAATVLHPVLTSGPSAPSGQRQTIEVDDYFSLGPRQREWFGAPVVWHHRTIDAYAAALRDAGFTLTDLSECPPERSAFGDNDAEYERRLRTPLFLLLKAKPAT